MRIGVHLPNCDASGKLLNADGVAERAKMVEAAGLDGIWQGDHTPVAGDLPRDHPEPFMTMLVAALATTKIEVGTAIYGVPPRNAADLAMHLYTMETYAPGRFSFGVGTGSAALEYEIAGLSWDDRFRRLHAHMDQIRSIFDGKPEPHVAEMIARAPSRPGGEGGDTSEPTWPMRVGRPRFLLGAWWSEPQLKRAAAEFDGWIASAGPGSRFGGWVKVKDAIKQFRDFGGKRALFSTIAVDLHVPTEPLPDDGSFNLRCGPEEASERLHFLEELGFDDVMLNTSDITNPLKTRMAYHWDFDSEDLERYRSLLPKDTRDYHDL